MLNARWVEMMEKMQTDSTQGGEKIYRLLGIELETL
jgi:hypothetical protein